MTEAISVDIQNAPLARGNLPAGSLPEGYIEHAIEAVRDTAKVVMFELGVTPNNRDFDHKRDRLASIVSAGSELAPRLPWFSDYYHTELRDIASEAMGEVAVCLAAEDEMLLGLVFGPGMRIEAHTDVWAINANLFLKAALKKPGTLPELSGATVIGHKDAKSHTDIIRNPLAVVPGKMGTLTLLAASEYPHTIGVAESPVNFIEPDITDERFWDNQDTRISLNISYATERQLAEHPELRPMTERVGYSLPVLGKSR